MGQSTDRGLNILGMTIAHDCYLILDQYTDKQQATDDQYGHSEHPAVCPEHLNEHSSVGLEVDKLDVDIHENLDKEHEHDEAGKNEKPDKSRVIVTAYTLQ